MKKGILPRIGDESKMSRFWNCLGVIMESQLRSLCLISMEDYRNYLIDINVSFMFYF